MLDEALAMDFPPHYQPGLSHAGYYHPSIQQTHRLYSIGDTPTLDHEAQYQAGQAADLQLHVQQPFNSGDSEDASASAPAPTSSFTKLAGPSSRMGPPTQSRKRKALTLREADWEPYKARILELFTTQELPLPKVKQIIEEEYGFKAEYVLLVRNRVDCQHATNTGAFTDSGSTDHVSISGEKTRT